MSDFSEVMADAVNLDAWFKGFSGFACATFAISLVSAALYVDNSTNRAVLILSVLFGLTAVASAFAAVTTKYCRPSFMRKNTILPVSKASGDTPGISATPSPSSSSTS